MPGERVLPGDLAGARLFENAWTHPLCVFNLGMILTCLGIDWRTRHENRQRELDPAEQRNYFRKYNMAAGQPHPTDYPGTLPPKPFELLPACPLWTLSGSSLKLGSSVIH